MATADPRSRRLSWQAPESPLGRGTARAPSGAPPSTRPPRRRPRPRAHGSDITRENLALELERLEQLAQILEATDRHGEAHAARGISERLALAITP
jgi:hypothetical protein